MTNVYDIAGALPNAWPSGLGQELDCSAAAATAAGCTGRARRQRAVGQSLRAVHG